MGNHEPSGSSRAGSEAPDTPGDQGGSSRRRLRERVDLETETDPPMDVLFDVLSNERRRWVCRFLDAEPGCIQLGELAEFIAAMENDVAEWMVSSAERKRVYISLLQCHLPKMDDARVVQFDRDRKYVRTGLYMELCIESLTRIEALLGSTDTG